MKIGILTFHFAENYGAVMQAYALMAHLRSLGHDAELIDYRPRYMTHGGRLRIPTSRRNLKINAQVLFIKWANLKTKLLSRGFADQFTEFQRQHLILSERTLTSHDELRHVADQYHAVVCGSDQIWNPPLRYGLDPAYFAAFAPPSVRKIAYAASFGRSDIEEEYHPRLRELLLQMDDLGVREQSGIDLIDRLTGRKAILTPDPTFLLNDYSRIMGTAESEEFLFAYVLRGQGLIGELIHKFGEKLKIKAVTPFNPHQRWKLDAEQRTLSPGDWLAHIRRARFVVTNSFHGTVFCILFQKPFVAIGLDGKKRSLSGRLTALLEQMGLMDRWLDPSGETTVDSILERAIDWDAVMPRISELRASGNRFLQETLARIDA
ncbi:MAG: polysaccharide pyruvyl transferase family protein [Phycisphaeraceae bacterium]|nr:polysaccharide pyruvyl transferase family protein [Phycisphaeraceae bacterium]